MVMHPERPSSTLECPNSPKRRGVRIQHNIQSTVCPGEKSSDLVPARPARPPANLPPSSPYLLFVEEGRSEIGSSRLYQGVQLREQRDGPHGVAAHERENERRSPQSVPSQSQLLLPSESTSRGRAGNVHLVLALGREEPRRNGHADHDDEADDDAPPEIPMVSYEGHASVCSGRRFSYPLAILTGA